MMVQSRVPHIIRPGALFDTIWAGADVWRILINLIMSATCQFLSAVATSGDSEEANGKWCSRVHLMSYHQL